MFEGRVQLALDLRDVVEIRRTVRSGIASGTWKGAAVGALLGVTLGLSVAYDKRIEVIALAAPNLAIVPGRLLNYQTRRVEPGENALKSNT